MFKAEIKVRQLSFHTFWSSQMLTEHNFRGKYFLRMALQIEVGQVGTDESSGSSGGLINFDFTFEVD